LDIVIPNEAEPWETLDLYSWDGTAWRWLPGRLDRQREVLTAQVATLPQSIMVMQTTAEQQTLVTESSDLLPPNYAMVLNQLDLVGMKIGTLGELNGDPGLLPPGSASPQPVLAPTVRNWVPGRDPNRELVTDMLGVDADRATHITNLTTLVKNGAYQGVVLDYRNLRAEDRGAYATFVTDLAKSLHEAGAWLAVTVDEPQKLESGWDTSGYDWIALGAAADQVRVTMPLNPQAYAPGGLAEQLVAWGTTQISRYKFYPIFTTLSTDGSKTVTMDETLAQLGSITVTQVLTESVLPGTALTFNLESGATVESDALTGASRLKLGETSVWLGTPQWLRSRLDLTARYNLGGVVVRDLLAEGNFPQLDRAMTDYLTGAAPVVYAGPEVVWSVTTPGGQQTQSQTTLANPTFAWAAPEITGTYRIAAMVAGLERGTKDITVATMAKAPVEGEAGVVAAGAALPAGAGEEEPEATPTETPKDLGLRASFVADVTVPDNTKLEKSQDFTKTWRVKNSGSQPWPADTVLAFSGEGQQLTEAKEVAIGKVVEPGQEIELSVPMKAPAEDGTYRSVWTLKTGNTAIPGGSFYVLFKIGEAVAAPAPAPAPGPVAPVASGPFALGGHIMQGFAYADYMRSAGMTWAKEQIRYPDDPSGIIAAAHANGFKIQLSALGPSSMVTQGGFEDAIAQWVAGMAAAGADAIEIWNEPNLDREWDYSKMNPQAYTNLLCRAYAAIKAANPGTKVISAAPSPTGAFGGCACAPWGQCGCDDIPWLQGMYNAGAASCMDYLGAHHNSGATSPSATSGHPADPGAGHHSWYFLPQTRTYYNIFGGTRKLFYTELGYVSPEGYGPIPGPFSWAAATTVAQQAQWLGEVVRLSRQTGMVATVIVWNVGAQCYGICGNAEDPQAGYNIIRPDGSCPACAALAGAMQ